jgi:hypothetical protein
MVPGERHARCCHRRTSELRWQRDRLLATNEDLRLLDSVTKKLSAPAAPDAPPDGQQNQIESKPAIKAVVMESDTASE